MSKRTCENCLINPAILRRPKDHSHVCKPCFFRLFERDIHETILNDQMFEKNEQVVVAVSGGKDSTVLAYVLDKLNREFGYGLRLVMVCIDEGIQGYRDESIQTVKRNQAELFGHLQLNGTSSSRTSDTNSANKDTSSAKIDRSSTVAIDPKTRSDTNSIKTDRTSTSVIDPGTNLESNLHIFSYKNLFTYTMDEIMKYPISSCTYCGVFRRNALDHAARSLKIKKIVTGHNAEDMAETVLLNMVRGDFNRFTSSMRVNNSSKGNLADSGRSHSTELCEKGHGTESRGSGCYQNARNENIRHESDLYENIHQKSAHEISNGKHDYSKKLSISDSIKSENQININENKNDEQITNINQKSSLGTVTKTKIDFKKERCCKENVEQSVDSVPTLIAHQASNILKDNTFEESPLKKNSTPQYGSVLEEDNFFIEVSLNKANHLEENCKIKISSLKEDSSPLRDSIHKETRNSEKGPPNKKGYLEKIDNNIHKINLMKKNKNMKKESLSKRNNTFTSILNYPDIEDVLPPANTILRLKPFKYMHQKEIVFYAHFKNLSYFSTECPYALGAHREIIRNVLVNIDTRKILKLIRSGEYFTVQTADDVINKMFCNICGNSCNKQICKKCELVQGLDKIFGKRPGN